MEVWKQFEENKITHSAAHHLIAVMELKKNRGYARVTDVAKHLNITTGSASTNLKNLKQKRYIVEDDNRFLELTEEGEKLAQMVLRRKKILQDFLTEVLDVDSKQAEIDVCKTEHLISLETTEKLENFIEKHRRDREQEMKAKLKAALKEAMKARDKVRLDAIRLILTAIQYEEVQKQVDNLPDPAVLAILQNEAKKRRETIEFAEKAGRPEQKDLLLQEIAVVESFLPKQLTAEELEKIILDLKTAVPGINVGAAMKSLKEQYAGQFDGELASDVAKRVLA